MINIAIDGTAGSGKGTISELLAKKLGYYHLDTGAIYRSLTYFLIQEKVDLNDEKEICKTLEKIDFKVKFERDKDGNQVQKNLLFGGDLKNKIRTEEISVSTSRISKFDCVRKFATKIQHELALKYDLIIEGRDIGTVVLPNADYKFFLTAKPEIRAKRRAEQLNQPQNYDKILKDIIERDEADMKRKSSPLKRADDAILIDNSFQTAFQTLSEMISYIK